ncbi:PEP-CTERM sorting domain-containing protein [Pseudorhodoferax sp.]|uniref:PEP-CTERM sorting domain-containing protein n=1 Tax=Pseudorhodoferax sp. TaxID=1993553 RepID=UPI002DD644AA|nr:PEP-CTERM sorting domain-containing protein [Pseudorhodoferax sp.]
MLILRNVRLALFAVSSAPSHALLAIGKTMKLLPRLAFVSALALATVSASAATASTETFDAGANGWLTGTSAAPTHHTSGGVGDSGYVSFTSTFTSGASGPFGAPPLQILFRGNNAADASGDAFVGNWLEDGIQSFSVTVRHNHTEALNLYARFDAGSGRAASLAYDAQYAIAPDTWTTITISIADGNPPFLSYGAGSFDSVFSNIQNLQVGLYLPTSTTFANLRFDLDNVSTVTPVPEPASLALFMLGGIATVAAARPQRRAR